MPLVHTQMLCKLGYADVGFKIRSLQRRNNMSIFDAIKKSVLEGFSAEITLADIIISLLLAFLSGLFILLIYRLTMRGVSRNRTFEVTLLLISPISAMIVLTITSNLALSLGMVGALSIVRFRTQRDNNTGLNRENNAGSNQRNAGQRNIKAL